MIGRTIAFTLISIAIAMNCDGAQSPAKSTQPWRPRTTLLFVDVTSSLTQLQIDRVIETSNAIIQGMRDGSTLYVYAIQSDPHAVPFREHQFVRAANRSQRNRAHADLIRLKAEVSKEIFDLYCSINWNDERTKKACRERHVLPRPQNDLRSCILGTLTHISRKIEDLEDAKKGPVHVIYVSDMIEECERNPLGEMIKLTHRDLTSDVGNVAKFRSLPDFGGARITVIVPRALDEQRDSRLPSFDDLRSYWGAVFSKCNADWRFESEIPESLKPKKRG